MFNTYYTIMSINGIMLKYRLFNNKIKINIYNIVLIERKLVLQHFLYPVFFLIL